MFAGKERMPIGAEAGSLPVERSIGMQRRSQRTREHVAAEPDSQHVLRVLHLFDAYLNIYADRGNIMVLRARCGWREIGCVVDGLDIDETFDPDSYDLIYVGGGQDRDQRMIADRMAGTVGAALRAAAGDGVAMLAVCGGYQLLGSYYRDVSGVEQPGACVLDLRTEAGATRLIGNVAIEATLPAIGIAGAQTVTVAGFENHAGRTLLGEGATPLGRVVHGHGNDGESGFEGCVRDRVLGTYLHGPLLPRNPEIADWLIAAALEHRYGDDAPALAPLSDRLAALERQARAVQMGRAAAG